MSEHLIEATKEHLVCHPLCGSIKGFHAPAAVLRDCLESDEYWFMCIETKPACLSEHDPEKEIIQREIVHNTVIGVATDRKCSQQVETSNTRTWCGSQAKRKRNSQPLHLSCSVLHAG
jgi:hypothetical protein